MVIYKSNIPIVIKLYIKQVSFPKVMYVTGKINFILHIGLFVKSRSEV